ncbi:MAG: PASTA domain-containing protein [Acidimicrobiales bacterium]|nr:PASTA domain-containing protein [Acidimicrobiales bacterium]
MPRSFMGRLPAALVALALLATSCDMFDYTTRDLIPPEEPPVAQTSIVLDRNGDEIVRLEAEQDRIPVTLDEIPEILQQAVIAIEDERFYDHSGFDFRGILRAAVRNIEAGSKSEGASTITQQYVGNVFLDRSDDSFRRKWDEIILARQFEDRYSKQYILERYLNWVYFGEGAYGVEAAAQRYFGKTAMELELPQAALLAGLIQRPGALNPYENRDGAIDRREQVLNRMLINEYITEDQFLEANDDNMADLVQEQDVEDIRYVGGHFVEEVRRWFLSGPEECPGLPEDIDERTDLLFEGGLTIQTTLDPVTQRQAENAVEAIIPDNETNPDAAVVVMEVGTANVVAMVGGRDFFGEDEDAKVNLAMGNGRQAGSSMKPIGLATALNVGVPITRTYKAESRMVFSNNGEPWTVRSGGGGRTVTLAEATRNSYNTVFAQMITGDLAVFGPEQFKDMAHQLGVETDFVPVPSAILGGVEVTMLDMASAYQTFANDGLQRDAIFVTEIQRADGTILCTPPQNVQPQPVLSSDVARQITWALTQVISDGTGTRAQIGRPAAGKTGTAQNNADATFVGYTPEYVTAVWVGFPEGQIPMRPPTTDIIVQGGTWPAQIWGETMAALHGETPATEFGEPPPSSTTTTTTIYIPPPPKLVPDVEGLKAEEAELILAEAGFSVNLLEQETNGTRPGLVMVQVPAGGEVTTARTINLEISIPPSTPGIVVPRVTGKPGPDAVAQLQALGLNVVQLIEQQPSKYTPERAGLAYRQAPRPGSTVMAGDTVTVYINP